MRSIGDSDVFNTSSKTKTSINTKIARTLGGTAEGTVVLNRKLNSQLAQLRATFKESIVRKICESIDNGEILLYISPEYNLPTCMPFYKYNKGGRVKVNVNLTNYLTIDKDEEGKDIYNIEVKKLYAMLVPAYLYLKCFDKKTTLPPTVAEISAKMWAKMFCKVLTSDVGLSTNPERYEAFMYFGIRFFLSYFLEAPIGVVDNISMNFLKNRNNRAIKQVAGDDVRSPMIRFIEDQIDTRDIKINESLNVFLQTMFNYEITGIKHSKITEKGKSLSVHYFMNKWITMYDYASLFALGSFPYFLYVILSVHVNAFIVNDRILEDIVNGNVHDMPKLMNALYLML